MSQNRQLRLHNLPGQQEAVALATLIKEGKVALKVNAPAPPLSLLLNVIINAFERDKKVQLDGDDGAQQRLTSYFQKKGFDHLVIHSAELKSAQALREKLLKILSTSTETSDNSGSWRRYHKIIEQLGYGDYVISEVSMGEKPLHAVMERFLELKTRFLNVPIEEGLTRADYQFDANEFWHIRGRIREAISRYDNIFDDLTGLEELHSVFVEMYRPEEAEGLITDILTSIQKDLTGIQSAVHQWITSYRKHYLAELSEFGLLVRDHAFSISGEIDELLNTDKEATSRSGWNWLSRGGDEKELAKEQIRSAYNSLRKMIGERNLSSVFELKDSADLQDIQNSLQEKLKNFHHIRRGLKRHVDEHIGRANGHNIAIAVHQQRYDMLKSRIRHLLHNVNSKQLFKTYWEDNTLDVVSQKRWLDKMALEVRQIIKESPHLKAYLEWKQFVSLIDQKDLHILNVLRSYPKEQWLDRFDLWYYENFIEAQDLIPLDYNTQLKSLNKFTHTLLASSWKHSLMKATASCQGRLKQLLRNRKDLRNWIEKGQSAGFILDKEVSQKIAACFPVSLVGENDNEEIHHDTWNITQNELTSAGIKIECKDTSREAACFAPGVKPNIIHSTHSDRIQDIKAIARHFMNWRGEFEIWQNQDQVYFSFAEHGAQDLIYQWLSKDLRRHAINQKGDLDLVVECMLNGNNRHFYAIFTQHHHWQKDNWAFQMEHQRWISFVKHVGFEPLFISWYSIFKNADFIATLEREKSTREERKPSYDKTDQRL